MHSLIQLLRSELVAIIKRIGNGNCDISDVDDMNEVITVLRKTTHRISRCLSMRTMTDAITITESGTRET